MKREIAVAITGDLDALLRAWKPPPGAPLTRHGDEIHVVFAEAALSTYEELEATAAQMAPGHEVEVVGSFRAVDFSADDLRASDLLWMRIPATSGLEVVGESPLKTVICDRCGRKRFVLNALDQFRLRALEEPKRPMLAAVTVKLASREVLEGLAKAGIDSGLRSLTCSIAVGANELDDRYSWITGTTDLGDPVGDIELGPLCEKCGLRSVVSNRAFLWPFSRQRWNGEDFCTSSFLSLDTIFVSQRVYQHLEDSSAARSSGAIFEPIELK